MGIAQPQMDVPVLKSTSGILFLTEAIARRFEEKECVKCAKCVDVCPTFCLKLVPLAEIVGEGIDRLERRFQTDAGEPLSAIIKEEERCIRCALCAERCPTEAITMERFLFKEDWVDRQVDET